MFIVEYVKDLQWDNFEHTKFNCIVKYEEFSEEMPATISPSDPYAHIQEIWVKGNEGDYGSIAEYVVPVPSAGENKNKAVQLLQATDWTSIADIADPAVSNPYLMNQAEFLAYRSALREIAVNPQAGFIVFPVKPNEQWSS